MSFVVVKSDQLQKKFSKSLLVATKCDSLKSAPFVPAVSQCSLAELKRETVEIMARYCRKGMYWEANA
jgi:hypothetical protein